MAKRVWPSGGTEASCLLQEKMIRPLASSLLPLVCLVGLTACSMFGPARTPKVPSPAATTSSEPVRLPPAPQAQEPEQLPAPPRIESATGEVPAPGPPVARLETSPPPREPVARPSRPAKPQPKPSTESPEPAAEPFPDPPPSPRLTQLLSEKERWDYGQEIDKRLLRIHQLISELEKRPLKEDQMALLDRVRGFVRQTNETRQKDPVTAKSLAQRAELLAEELETASR
jgi:hypothetical protein